MTFVFPSFENNYIRNPSKVNNGDFILVEYRGEVEGLIATPEDFFSDFDTLLPGDKREGVAYIKNTTKDEIEVFFKTEPLDKAEYYDDIDYSLLEKISLKISLKKTSSSEEQVLYNGNLGAESMSEFVSLGEYVKGFDGEFIFRIEVPTSLRNDYTLARTKVKWVFAVEKKKETKNNESNNDENDGSNSNGNNNSLDNNEKDSDNKINNGENNKKQNAMGNFINQVQTGDKIHYIIAVMVISILIIAVLSILGKKEDK